MQICLTYEHKDRPKHDCNFKTHHDKFVESQMYRQDSTSWNCSSSWTSNLVSQCNKLRAASLASRSIVRQSLPWGGWTQWLLSILLGCHQVRTANILFSPSAIIHSPNRFAKDVTWMRPFRPATASTRTKGIRKAGWDRTAARRPSACLRTIKLLWKYDWQERLIFFELVVRRTKKGVPYLRNMRVCDPPPTITTTHYPARLALTDIFTNLEHFQRQRGPLSGIWYKFVLRQKQLINKTISCPYSDSQVPVSCAMCPIKMGTKTNTLI